MSKDFEKFVELKREWDALYSQYLQCRVKENECKFKMIGEITWK